MHPTVADVASPFLPSIRHAKSAPPCKAKTLANAQVSRASTAEIYPLNSTKTHKKVDVYAEPVLEPEHQNGASAEDKVWQFEFPV